MWFVLIQVPAFSGSTHQGALSATNIANIQTEHGLLFAYGLLFALFAVPELTNSWWKYGCCGNIYNSIYQKTK